MKVLRFAVNVVHVGYRVALTVLHSYHQRLRKLDISLIFVVLLLGHSLHHFQKSLGCWYLQPALIYTSHRRICCNKQDENRTQLSQLAILYRTS